MNCPACGSANTTIYPRDDGSAYGECGDCDVSFTINP